MTIVATIISFNELEQLKECIPSISKYVDYVFVGVDNRTTDSTCQWLEKNEIYYMRYDFNNDYGEVFNVLNTRVYNSNPSGIWNLCLEPDEKMIPKYASKLKDLTKQGDLLSINAFKFKRNNWLDENMSKIHVANSKDYPIKLYRVTDKIRFYGKIDPIIVNAKSIQISNLEIEHFFYAYNSLEDRNKKIQEFNKLKKLEIELGMDKIKIALNDKNKTITS